MALRAVVVGAGIGGTAAALALALAAGIDVQVYEQARQLGEVGAGVSLAPNGLRFWSASASARGSDGQALGMCRLSRCCPTGIGARVSARTRTVPW